VRRLIILLTAVGALLIAPAAHAEVGVEPLKVILTGSGSGEAVVPSGGSSYRGSPEINCKYNGTSQSGVCETTMSDEGEGWEQVFVEAKPAPGSKFSGWTVENAEFEGCAPTGSFPSSAQWACAPFVEPPGTGSGEAKIIATFVAEPPSEFALTVVPAGTGSGTVTSSPAGINCGIDCSEAYATGTEVTLTATAASGSTFSGWSGDCAGTGACKVTMSQARNVTATFAKEPATTPPGTVSVGSTAKVKSGKALLKLTCNGEGPCKGSLKLTAKIKSGGKTKNKTIGKGSFSLAAGGKTTLKVKLSGPANQAVAKKPLKAKVSGSGVRGSTVKLKK
jgi:hypothetical protein